MDGRESPEMMQEILIETNAMRALKGMRSVSDEFMGGNANILEDGRVYAQYNFSFLPESGQILEFATHQHVSLNQQEEDVESANIAHTALVVAYDLRGPTATQEAMQIAHGSELSDSAKHIFKKTIDGLNNKLKTTMV